MDRTHRRAGRRQRVGSTVAAMAVGLLVAGLAPTAAAASPIPGFKAPGAGDDASVAGTTIDVTASATSIVSGDAIVLRYTVTADGAPLGHVPTTVHFAGGVFEIQTTAAGTGAISTRALPVGKPVIVVRFGGDAQHGAASVVVPFVVAPRPVTIVGLTPAPATSTAGPSAVVSFQLVSSVRPLANARVAITTRGATTWVRTDANGRVSYQVVGLAPGPTPILVRYFGDRAHARATATTSVLVTNACPATARACVDLTNNLSWIQDGGRITYGPVPITSGMPGHRTRVGTFHVYWKHKNHRSSLFNGAPMPNSLFFDGGIAFHQGSLVDASHGCIHLSRAASEEFWDRLGVGATVYVWGAAQY